MARPSKEFQAFRDLTDRLLAVPHETVARKMAEHRDASAQNPKKRGPKPKATAPSADPDQSDVQE